MTIFVSPLVNQSIWVKIVVSDPPGCDLELGYCFGRLQIDLGPFWMMQFFFSKKMAFLFILFCLIFSFIFMITNSSKYRVMNINYDNSLSLNFESFETLKYRSIWFINESDFEEFYSSNLVVERLLISKQFPNTLEIEISTHEKILHFTDFRSTLPKVKTLYKNLLISEKIE